MKYTTYPALSSVQQKLVDEAEKVMKEAYNPYSHFYVGAALLTKDGIFISGANVENAAYGSTICAERSALLRANAMGYRQFESIAIITRGETFDVVEPSAPCGSCRQMINEAAQLSNKNIEIILSSTQKEKIILSSIEELLPLSFGPRDLGMDIKKYQKSEEK